MSTLVAIECDTPAEYRWLRQLCARCPAKAKLLADGRIEVLDTQWFARALAACNGRVMSET
jgi:hypothetical protein